MFRFFEDGMMIGASVDEVLAYFAECGIVPGYVQEESEYEIGLICSAGPEDEGFVFEIEDGVVDCSYWEFYED